MLYLFDFDKTLYAYDFRRRLPALSRLSGVSQYRLASRWWAAGYERRAESGEWPDAESYLDEFARVTGARLDLAQWTQARREAMTRIDESIRALELAATLGEVSLLSNNPSAFGAALPELAPEVVEVLGERILLSCTLGIRKPDPETFRRATDRYGVAPEDALLLDDNAENVEGARAAGLAAHHVTWTGGVPDTDAMIGAVRDFAAGRTA